MKKIRLLALISAVATALVLYVFLKSLNRPVEIVKVSVIVAAENIPAFTQITPEMLKTVEYPPQAVLTSAITKSSEIVGKVSRFDIYSGEQLLIEKLVATGAGDSKTLAYALEPGMRAITLPVSETSGLAYMITPGNHIDLIGQYLLKAPDAEQTEADEKMISYAVMVLENIRVLAVDNVLSEKGKAGSQSPAYTTLTLEVTPEQAMKLSEAQFEGELRAILRSPVDVEETNQPRVTLDDVIGKDAFGAKE